MGSKKEQNKTQTEPNRKNTDDRKTTKQHREEPAETCTPAHLGTTRKRRETEELV